MLRGDLDQNILDDTDREVILMRHFEELTNQEVAHSLGIVERTVERQWAYAKAWLFRDLRAQSMADGEDHPVTASAPQKRT